MKDFLGHGSNSKGSNSALTKTQGPAAPMPRGPSGKGGGGKGFGTPAQIQGGVPVSSNAQAAQALMSRLKSTQAPIHSSMVGRPSPTGGSAS